MDSLQSTFHMTTEFCCYGVCSAEDSYFYAALSTVRRKIMGMRDSLITSSTWQTNFKGVLEKYPVLSMVGMDFAVPGCDACNLGARMSKMVGRVSGQPYDRSTFEVSESLGVTRRLCIYHSVNAVDRSPSKIQILGDPLSRTRAKMKTKARGPRKRCIWGDSAPSGRNRFTSSVIGRCAIWQWSYIYL